MLGLRKGLVSIYSFVLTGNLLGYQQGHGAEDDQTLQGRQEERTGLCQEQAKARGAWKQSPPEDQEGASRLPRKLGKTEISSGVTVSLFRANESGLGFPLIQHFLVSYTCDNPCLDHSKFSYNKRRLHSFLCTPVNTVKTSTWRI